jgi:hypothetical protein
MRSLRNLFVSLLLLASLASATVLQTFDSRTSWEAATTGRIDINFESLGLGVGGYQSYSTVGGLTTGGVTFVGVDTTSFFLYALNPPGGAEENFGTNTILKGPYMNAASYLRIVLPAATTSFGIDLMTYFPNAQSVQIKLDGIQVGLVVTQNRPTPTFFGFTTDTAISDLRIYVATGTPNFTQGLFDNVSYGTAGTSGSGTGSGTGGDIPGEETPEIATMLALGSGLMMLRWLRRRTIMSAAAA